MTVFVSMLRAVNVGKHGRLNIAALKELHEELGLGHVQTYLASGNVLFTSRLKDRARLTKRIMQEIERRFDLEIEVILRHLEEIRNIVVRGPVLSPRADPSKLLVMFLAAAPSAQAQAALLKAHSGPEMIEIRGPEIYLYYPNGVGRSKLTSTFIESKLGTSGTARNWNTVTKLLELGEALGGGPG
jgi:uncharacterized protein (DUF1697 family)